MSDSLFWALGVGWGKGRGYGVSGLGVLLDLGLDLDVQDDSMKGRARATVVATRVAPADSVRKPQLASHQMHDGARQRTAAALLGGLAAPGTDRLRAPSAPGIGRNFLCSLPTTARSGCQGPSRGSRSRPRSRRLVRKGGMASGETEKKSKWMDLPAIWRRARRGESAGDKANEG